MTTHHRQRLLGLFAILVIGVLVAVLQSGSAPTDDAATTKHGVALPPLLPPALQITPRPGATNVAPVGEVAVTATAGTLTDVRMTNEQGRVVAGQLSADRTAWKPAEPLGYGRSYTLAVTGRGTNSTTVTRTTDFTTVTPQNQADVSFNTTLGTSLVEGGTYGVGTVIVAQFDRPVTDRAAAQNHLVVTTDPPVEGAWTWIDDRKAHWRPREYYPAGTAVTVRANVYGTDLGSGVYGAQDRSTSFRIGPSHVSIADDVTKQVSVYVDGRLVRTMPTSMGRGGTEVHGGKTVSYWTQPGVYTVMEKANPVIMDSSTYGVPVGAGSGYRLTVPYATRISPDGIYLHQLEDTRWAQGNTNVSAGCLNLNAENAKWFFELSQPGDVVEVRNTGGKPLEQWQNGDWSVPWETWLAGSAVSGRG